MISLIFNFLKWHEEQQVCLWHFHTHSVWVDSSFSCCPGPCPTGLFQPKHCPGYFPTIYLSLKQLLPISWARFSLADCYPHTLHINTHIQQLEARTHTRERIFVFLSLCVTSRDQIVRK